MEYPEYKCNAIRNLVGSGFHMNADHSIEYLNGQTPPTKEEIDAEIVRLEKEFTAQDYARARQPLYPAIGDQLDDLYHAGVFSAEMTAKLKKVKDDNPK